MVDRAPGLENVWLTAGQGLDLTVESSPSSDHSIKYFRESQKRAYLWLARQLQTR